MLLLRVLPLTDLMYVVSYENNGSKNVAKYWKNGVAMSLSNGSQNTFARSITISGADVYVAGYEYNGTKYIAKY